ncbi:hypothetical protein Tco_0059163 [Tanacetum coccineum]
MNGGSPTDPTDGKVHSYCGLRLADIPASGSDVPAVYHDFGPPSYQCSMYNMTMWYDERNDKAKRAVNLSFSLCCQEDQNTVTLRDSKNLPALLEREGKKMEAKETKKIIGGIVYSTPASGERYYLRMLLNVVRGARSFEELRMVNKISYVTFKAACFSYGILNGDKEWTHAIS